LATLIIFEFVVEVIYVLSYFSCLDGNVKLSDCLGMFVEEEELSGDNAVECDACQKTSGG